LLTFIGASSGLTKAVVEPGSASGDALLSADCVVTCGFMAQHPGLLELAVAVGEARRRTPQPPRAFALNLGAVYVCSGAAIVPGVVALARLADTIVGNAAEAEALVAACGWVVEEGGESRLARLAKRLATELFACESTADPRKRIVVITDGARPTAVAGTGVDAALIEIRSDVLVSAGEVVDDTGAGDAFLGGLLAGRARGMGLEASVRVGHWAAAHVVRRRGAAFCRDARCDFLN